MNWQLIGIILASVFAVGVLTIFTAVIILFVYIFRTGHRQRKRQAERDKKRKRKHHYDKER